jgi:hypothetical protein
VLLTRESTTVPSELPDLDEDVSFVVDDGASMGPLSMRLIVDSIVSGDRLASALVWWAGATDWVHFEAHDGLVALLQAETTDADLDASAEDDVDQAEEDVVDEKVEDAEAEVEVAATEDVSIGEDVDPRSLHPSFRWGAAAQSRAPKSVEVDVEPDVDVDVDVELEVEQAPLHQMATLDQFDLAQAADVREIAESDEVVAETEVESPVDDEAVTQDGAITGLFGAVARVDGGLSAQPETSAASASDEAIAARVSLQSVGARIEALTSATRRSQAVTARFVNDSESETALLASVSSVETEFEAGEHGETTTDVDADAYESSGGSWQAVDEAVAETEAAANASSVASTSAVQSLTARFEEMVRTSEAHQRRIEWVMRVDELLLSGCITAIADSGFVASDLSSEDSDHLVLFDHNDDSRRVRLELAPVDSVGDQLGRHVRFSLGWGRDVADLDQAIQTVGEHAGDSVAPSGSVTCEADHQASTVSTRVELIWAADDFVKDDYSVDRLSLDSSIAAALHALESRWHELFVAS